MTMRTFSTCSLSACCKAVCTSVCNPSRSWPRETSGWGRARRFASSRSQAAASPWKRSTGRSGSAAAEKTFAKTG